MKLTITIEPSASPLHEHFRISVKVRDDGHAFYAAVPIVGEVIHGLVRAPRADHPHYAAQLARRVLDHAFPFQASTRYTNVYDEVQY